MSAAAVMAIVLFLFFLVGVAAGVILVAALSARRAQNAARLPIRPRHRRGGGHTGQKQIQTTMGRTNLAGGTHAAAERVRSARLRAAGCGKGPVERISWRPPWPVSYS